MSKFITPSGNPEKTIYKLDRISNSLVPIKKIDFQAYIDSFSEETNYKGIIESISHQEITPEVILEHFPIRKNVFFGDLSEVSPDILENIDLANAFAEDYGKYIEELEKAPKSPKKKDLEPVKEEDNE